jgi:hypothetical protein
MQPIQYQAVVAVLKGGAAAAWKVAETTAKRTRTVNRSTSQISTSGGTQLHQYRLPMGSKQPYTPPSGCCLEEHVHNVWNPLPGAHGTHQGGANCILQESRKYAC